MANAIDILERARASGYRVRKTDDSWHVTLHRRRCAVIFSSEALLVYLAKELGSERYSVVWG